MSELRGFDVRGARHRDLSADKDLESDAVLCETRVELAR
jgi:hypothetical protein